MEFGGPGYLGVTGHKTKFFWSGFPQQLLLQDSEAGVKGCGGTSAASKRQIIEKTKQLPQEELNTGGIEAGLLLKPTSSLHRISNGM